MIEHAGRRIIYYRSTPRRGAAVPVGARTATVLALPYGLLASVSCTFLAVAVAAPIGTARQQVSHTEAGPYTTHNLEVAGASSLGGLSGSLVLHLHLVSHRRHHTLHFVQRGVSSASVQVLPRLVLGCTPPAASSKLLSRCLDASRTAQI